MSYKALYRKYRPTTFEEVSGQSHIVTILKNALKTNKIGHAYLFAGPRGTGKTTMAKLFAKALNCNEGVGHQCNECQNCLAINNSSHPDVIEIDAASNNGVDEVRDLIDKVHYSTILGRYKVYIIDEVHMMTPGAFNALLKTLEEPPEHVIFILATTEPHKILPTILSRCQRFDFSKLSNEEIKNRLIYVLEKENVKYEDEALDIIISLCDGGMRDALSILDQVLAFSNDNLKAKDVLDIFSIESKQEKLNLLDDVANNDTASVLKRIKNYVAKGTDIKRLTSDILDILKDALIYNKTKNEALLEVLNEDEVHNLNNNFSYDSLISNIDIILEAIKNYKLVNNINPIFEIAFLKLKSDSNNKINNQENKTNIKITTSEQTKPYIKTKKIEEKENKEEIKEEIKEQKEEKNKIETVKEETLSLFDNIDESKISKEVLFPNVIRVEESCYKLSLEDLLNITVIAKRDIKTKYSQMWGDLDQLAIHPKYGSKATLLKDGHLLLATKSILIIEYDILANVNKINSVDAQKDLQAICQIVFKKKLFVYAISRKDSVDLQVKFRNLKEVNKLAKPDTIQITMIGEN